jgi:hypothetical protein
VPHNFSNFGPIYIAVQAVLKKRPVVGKGTVAFSESTNNVRKQNIHAIHVPKNWNTVVTKQTHCGMQLAHKGLAKLKAIQLYTYDST